MCCRAYLGSVLAFGMRAGEHRAAGEPLWVGVPGPGETTLWVGVQGPGE